MKSIDHQLADANQWYSTIIALMRDDIAISFVTLKRGLVVMVSREYSRNIGHIGHGCRKFA